MRDHKTTFLPTGIYDVAAVETWLADQAARGWLLEKLRPLGAVRLIRGTPADCQYRLEPVDGETLIRDADLRDYYSEAGWEFVCLSPGGDFRIWRSTRPDPVELHGDPEVEAGVYRRLSRRLYRACGLAALWALGMLYLLYPRASALQGPLERQVWETPGTRLPLMLLALGYLLVRSCAAAWAVHHLRRCLKRGVPLDHTKRSGAGRTWGRRSVLAVMAVLLAAGALWPSGQVWSEAVPPVLLSAELGGAYGNTTGFTTTGQSLLASQLVWSVETAGGSMADMVTEPRYVSLRLPFLAGPLLSEVAGRWDLLNSDLLSDARFDELYFRRREDRQYLALRRGGQVLYVYAQAPEDLTDHLDDYAASLAALQ